MADLFLLSEAQMRRIEGFFPLSHGIARVDDRRIVSAIVFVIRNGLRWRDAPGEYGPHKTIYNRFIRWSRLGVFNKIFAELARKGGKLERMIGRVWGDAALGLYDRAYKLLLFPLLQINAPLARVMLPMLARLRTDGPRYRSAYLQAVNQLLLVTQPGIVFAIATADIFVPILLGNDWRAAAPIFQWLGLAALLQPISVVTNWLFISQGRSGAYALWGAFNAAVCAVAFCVGLPWGPIGVAAAYSISQVLCRSPVVLWMATRTGPVRLQDLCSIGTMHALASAVSFGGIIVARHATGLDGIPGLVVFLCLSYALTVLALALIPSGRMALRESLSVVMVLVSRS